MIQNIHHSDFDVLRAAPNATKVVIGMYGCKPCERLLNVLSDWPLVEQMQLVYTKMPPSKLRQFKQDHGLLQVPSLATVGRGNIFPVHSILVAGTDDDVRNSFKSTLALSSRGI